MSNKNIHYQIEPHLSPEEFICLLNRSSLGQRRPVQEPERIKSMLDHASLILTARIEDQLIGVARALTDYSFCTYLSDLAVDLQYQKRGIGKELIRRTKMETPQAKLILLAAPQAVDYYPKLGMTRHEHCFFLDDAERLTK